MVRLRSMTVDATRTILVLDRIGAVGPDQAGRMGEHLQTVAERVGLAGGAVFEFDVELPDDEPAPAVADGAMLHTGAGQRSVYCDPDVVAALGWAVERLNTALADQPMTVGDHGAKLRLLRNLVARVSG